MMKKFLMFILILAALPLAAMAEVITPGYDGTGNRALGSAVNREFFVKLHANNTNFIVDSMQVMLYRQAAPNTETFRVNFYLPNGTATGACGCTNGPGTLLSTYGPFLAANNAANYYPNFYKIDLAPNDTLPTDFIMGVKITARGTNTGIISDDATTPAACCDQFLYYEVNADTFDNEAVVFGGIAAGVEYMAIFGTGLGAAQPGHLDISNLGSMGGAATDSTVRDTLILTNDGGTSLTISSITSNNAAFTTDPVGGGIVLAPNATRRLAVRFTPTTAGDQTGVLTFTDNVPGDAVTTDTLLGRGISHANLISFQNWFNATDSAWIIQRFGALDSTAFWRLFYSGNHNGGYTNVWAHHFYTPNAAPSVQDIIGSGKTLPPVGGSVQINFREKVTFASDLFAHNLAVAVNDTWNLGASLPASGESEWADYPTTYYLTNVTDTFRIGFYYEGSFADIWELDDILFQTVPQFPPVLQLVDPKGDVFSTASEIYCNAFDTNNDPITVQCWVETAALTFVAHAMADTGGTGDYCINISDFTNGSGTYRYYITATDNDGETRLPSTGYYSFDAQSQAGATELISHNGLEFSGHYYLDPLDEEAVRYTPGGYPFYLTAAKVNILNNFPDGAHQPIIIKVYADDGAGGLPGTLLLQDTTGSIGNACLGLTGFSTVNNVVIKNPVVINSGTFYISIRNLVSATQTEREAWGTDDSTGSGVNYLWDNSAGTWSLIADTAQGDIMMSALGYVGPNAPVLTIFANPGGASVNVIVDNTVGTIPATNIYTSPDGIAPYTLVVGSPFTSSPVTVNTASRAFFNAKKVFGPTNLSRELPNNEPVLTSTSLVTVAPNNIGVTGVSSSDAERFTMDMETPLSAKDVPNLMIRNDVTGEYKLVPMTKQLFDARSTEVVRPIELRGPVRNDENMMDKGGFESLTPAFLRN